MTRKEYIEKLAIELRGFEKASQTEILQELEGLIAESGCPDADLVQRFGTPQELAISYGKKTATPSKPIVTRVAKNIFLGIGVFTSLLVAIIVYVFWSFDADEFDYADSSHPLLTLGSSDWNEFQLDAMATLNVNQAQAIFYWHDSEQVSWKCSSSGMQDLGASMKIESNRCFVFLPSRPITINSTQAEIVIVGPNNDLDLHVFQSSVKIASLDKLIQLNVEKNESEVDSFASVDNPESTININAKQSSIGHYKY